MAELEQYKTNAMGERFSQSQILTRANHGDPIRDALKSHSTHDPAEDRILLYERLGLNKPGFWVDYKRQQRGEAEEEAYDFQPKTFEFKPYEFTAPTNPYKADAYTKRQSMKPLEMPEGQQTARAGGGKSKIAKPAISGASAVVNKIVSTSVNDLFIAESVKKNTAMTPAMMVASQSPATGESQFQKVERVLYKENKVKVKTNQDRKGTKVSSHSTEQQRQQTRKQNIQMVQQRSYSSPTYMSRTSGSMMNLG